MTEWQWQIIIQLIRLVLKLREKVLYPHEIEFYESDYNLLEEALQREENKRK